MVVAGDTLYSIAWRHQRDFRTLASINNIKKPYDIFPGQRLRIRGKAPAKGQLKPQPRPQTGARQQSTVAAASKSKSVTAGGAVHPLSQTRTKPQSGSQGVLQSKAPTRSKVTGPGKPAVALTKTGPVTLVWPSGGKRLRGFGEQPEGAQMPSRSIDFLLQPGASIRAAAAGEVVYVGRGLAGFEQFVIVKHNDTWLSAYGFNAIAGVREKQVIAKNAVLARVTGRSLGTSERDRQLHFEVRKNGTPVNPASVIK